MAQHTLASAAGAYLRGKTTIQPLLLLTQANYRELMTKESMKQQLFMMVSGLIADTTNRYVTDLPLW